jgi:hypothetical protein
VKAWTDIARGFLLGLLAGVTFVAAVHYGSEAFAAAREESR